MDSVGTLAGTLPFDAIEVDNSTPFLEWANLRAQRFAACHRRPALGASDAHILTAIGKSYTAFPGYSAAALRQAIKAGTCQAGARPYRSAELLDYFRFWVGYGRGTRTAKGQTGAVSALVRE